LSFLCSCKLSLKYALNGVSLQRVRETKFLGVVISDDLKWKKQVDVVVQKVSKIVGILSRTCYILDKDRLKLLYSTLLEPYIIGLLLLSMLCMVVTIQKW